MKSRVVASRRLRRIRRSLPKYHLLEPALISWVNEQRANGYRVHGTSIQTKARELMVHLYPDVSFKGSNGFLARFLKRNDLVQRTVTRVGQKIPGDAPKLCENFLKDMQSLSDKYDVIINMDETPMYFDIPSSRTIDFKGVSTIKMKTTGYIVALSAGVQKMPDGSYRGFRLPPLVIFKNLKKAPKGKFPPGMAVLCSKGGSVTDGFMRNVFALKILGRRPGGYFHSLSTLFLMDAATCHTKPEVLNSLTGEEIDTKIIHAGLTPLLQYLDTHVNKPFKGEMRKKMGKLAPIWRA